MASITNNGVNTGSVTNNMPTANNLTWDEAIYTWDASAPDTWDTQYNAGVTNRAVNTTTVTNNPADT